MWGFNAFRQAWPLESKQHQRNVQNRKGEKLFLSSTFQQEKIKHFLWSWLTVRSINLPQIILWPREICSLAFWNYSIQRPSFEPLLSKFCKGKNLAVRFQCDTCTDDLPENILLTWKCCICDALLKPRENLDFSKSPVFHWAGWSFSHKNRMK